MQNYLLMTAVLLLYSLLDSAQDKLNSSKYKRPGPEGVERTWYNWMPYPFVDLWHLIKKARIYLPVSYTVALWRHPELIPVYPGDARVCIVLAANAVLAWYVWQLLPDPDHWD